MPIYEFYCSDCHTVFNFLARRPDTSKRPSCPRCGRPNLDRKVSRFAIGRMQPESPETGDALSADLDDVKMERMMQAMERDFEGMNEDDPRQMGHMMRKLYEGAGLPLGKEIEEAIRRMEAGEDPDKIEEEMGDILEQDALFGEGGGRFRHLSDKLKPPDLDETLYDL